MDKQTVIHGGKRANSGRKPVADKKVQINIYIPNSKVTVLGMEAVKTIAENAINDAVKKYLEKT